jgi:hypothetical protein
MPLVDDLQHTIDVMRQQALQEQRLAPENPDNPLLSIALRELTRTIEQMGYWAEQLADAWPQDLPVS